MVNGRKRIKQLIIRDGLICRLCGNSLAREYKELTYYLARIYATVENRKKLSKIFPELNDKQRRSTIDISLDHVLPKSLGGRSGIVNLVLAHKGCNAVKGNKADTPLTLSARALSIAAELGLRHEGNNTQKAIKDATTASRKAALGTLQADNAQETWERLLYLWRKGIKRFKLAYRPSLAKGELRRIYEVRPARAAAPVLPLQHKPRGKRGSLLSKDAAGDRTGSHEPLSEAQRLEQERWFESL